MNLLQTYHAEKYAKSFTDWYHISLEQVPMRTSMLTLSKHIAGSLTWQKKLFRFEKDTKKYFEKKST